MQLRYSSLQDQPWLSDIMHRSCTPNLFQILIFLKNCHICAVRKTWTTHKISLESGPIKQYFFHTKPKLQLRLACLIMFRDSLAKLVSNLNFSQKMSYGHMSRHAEEHITTHKISLELSPKTVLFSHKTEIATKTRLFRSSKVVILHYVPSFARQTCFEF